MIGQQLQCHAPQWNDYGSGGGGGEYHEAPAAKKPLSLRDKVRLAGHMCVYTGFSFLSSAGLLLVVNPLVGNLPYLTTTLGTVFATTFWKNERGAGRKIMAAAALSGALGAAAAGYAVHLNQNANDAPSSPTKAAAQIMPAPVLPNQKTAIANLGVVRPTTCAMV